MDYLDKLCCICFCRKKVLKTLSDRNNDGMTYYNILTLSITGMCFEELNPQRTLCHECCDSLNIIYKFHQKCLRGKTLLIDYITQTKYAASGSYTQDNDEADIGQHFISVDKNESDDKKSDEKSKDGFETVSFQYVSVQQDNVPKNTNVNIKTENENSDDENEPFINPELKIEIKEHPVEDGSENDYLFKHEDEEQLDASETDLPNDRIELENEHGDVKISYGLELAKATEKNYECDICHEKFIYRSYLVTHMRRHSGEKPFKCNICQKEYSGKHILNKHMSIHTGERPFKCDLCSWDFRTKHNLKIHLQVHNGEKPFECNICNKRFLLLSTLKIHMRIHTGEKPYQCSICSKKFAHMSNLKQHLKLHTGENTHDCPVCGKKYIRLRDLNSHLRKCGANYEGMKGDLKATT